MLADLLEGVLGGDGLFEQKPFCIFICHLFWPLITLLGQTRLTLPFFLPSFSPFGVHSRFERLFNPDFRDSMQ